MAVSGRFDHILVDEYQDTNQLQSKILLSLKPKGSVFKAGRHTRPPAGSFLGESGIGVPFIRTYLGGRDERMRNAQREEEINDASRPALKRA
jgi:superfamily I DNA/RNA helicase